MERYGPYPASVVTIHSGLDMSLRKEGLNRPPRVRFFWRLGHISSLRNLSFSGPHQLASLAVERLCRRR